MRGNHDINELAWLLYQRKLNELAKSADVISENMYTYAKEELQRDIDILQKVCYV